MYIFRLEIPSQNKDINKQANFLCHIYFDKRSTIDKRHPSQSKRLGRDRVANTFYPSPQKAEAVEFLS